MTKLSSIFLLFWGISTMAVSTNLIAANCDNPLDANIKNSCIVNDTLWRGAKPDALAATTLIARGVKTVVNLELLHDDLDAFSIKNGAKVDAITSNPLTQTIQYFRIRDWEPIVAISHRAVDKHVAEFIAITRTQPAPIYVHCRSGRNRTGVMVAAYKVFNGTPIEEAVADMKRFKGEWFKYDAKYIRTLTPARLAALEKKVSAAQKSLEKEAEISCSEATCAIKKD
jgi:protein tyrosine/serine phosphatase